MFIECKKWPRFDSMIRIYLCKKTPKLVFESHNFNVHINISFEYVHLMGKIHLILYPFSFESLSNIS